MAKKLANGQCYERNVWPQKKGKNLNQKFQTFGNVTDKKKKRKMNGNKMNRKD